MFNTLFNANNVDQPPAPEALPATDTPADIDNMEATIETLRQRLAEADMHQIDRNDELVADDKGFGFHWKRGEESNENKEAVQKIASRLAGLEAIRASMKSQNKPAGSGLAAPLVPMTVRSPVATAFA